MYYSRELRIPDSYDANLPVIQLINHLFKIRQKDGLLTELQKLQKFSILAL